MTFTEHLGELRIRIIRSATAFFVAVLGCYIFSNTLLELIAYPLSPLASYGFFEEQIEEETKIPELPEGQEGLRILVMNPAAPMVLHVRSDKYGGILVTIPYLLYEREGEEGGKESGKGKSTAGPAGNNMVWTVLNPLEPVWIKIKMSVYGGLVISFPYILLQICGFVFPGLRDSERRVIQVLIYGCGGLAVLGVLVAYFGVLPFVLPYLANMVPEGWVTQLRVSETLSVIITVLVGFALAFQFPMVVLVLVRMGLLTPATLKQYRRVAIVGMAVAAALLTPPDPVTMVIMLLPLALLYESSIWLSYFVVKRQESAESE